MIASGQIAFGYLEKNRGWADRDFAGPRDVRDGRWSIVRVVVIDGRTDARRGWIERNSKLWQLSQSAQFFWYKI
jgi:hypothetical protein